MLVCFELIGVETKLAGGISEDGSPETEYLNVVTGIELGRMPLVDSE